MTKQRLLGDPTAVQGLARKLQDCAFITTLDSGEDREAWTLAHSFSDLESSFHKVFDTYLPELLSDADHEAKIKEILLEIGEELRHVLYHIRDPKFYRYLD